MTSEEYCKIAEEKDRLNKSLIPSVRINENYSSLTSLKNVRFNLLFEPSAIEGYVFLVRQEIVRKIDRINRVLDKQDKILIILSAWRSFEQQQMIWDNKSIALKKEFPDKSISEINGILENFIAPENKSMHATGGTVDALIFDRKTFEIMDFGTNEGFKIDLNEQCYPYHPDISDLAKKNRELLISLFEYEGFVVDPKKYWHFDYGNAIWAIEKEEKRAIYGVIKK